MMVMHDGLPFESLEEIAELGCTPNYSAQRGNSLNGEGLCQAAGLASHPDIEMAVASRMDNGIVAMRGRADFRGQSKWVVDDQSVEWSDIIHERFGDWPKLAAMNVFYAFRLEGRPAESPFAAKYMNELIWMCGSIGRSKKECADGKVTVFVCEKFLLDGETYGQVSAGGGSRRRPLISLPEYNARYQGGEFVIPAEIESFRIGQEKYRVCAEITVRSYPCERESAGSYLGCIRDGISDLGHSFSKGNTSSSNGCRPANVIYGYFPCLAGDSLAYSRFATDAQWKAPDPTQFLHEMELPYYDGTTKFAVAEFRVTGITPVSGGRAEPMRVAAAFGRGGDFMFTDGRAVRELCLEMCRLADRSSAGWKAAHKHFDEVFPTRHRDLVRFPVKWVFPTRTARFDIYDADTGEPFTREMTSGSTAHLAFWDTERGAWAAPAEVQVPTTFGHSVGISLPDSVRRGVGLLAEVAPNPQVVAIRVAEMARRDGDDWLLCEPCEYRHTSEFRPKRKIRLTVRGDGVNMCTVVDVPPRPRNSSEQPPERSSDGPRDWLNPYCDRHEFFVASLPRSSDFVMLCQNFPIVKKYFYERDPKLRDLIWTLYKSLNVPALKLREALVASEPGTVPPEMRPPPDAGPYTDDGLDFALNTLLKGIIADDPLVKALMKKIDIARAKGGQADV